MEVRVVATLKAKAEYLQEVTQAVTQAVAPARQEEGNIQYDLHEDINEPGVFLFFERWKSNEALEEHNKTAHFTALIAALENKVEFTTIRLLKSLV
ncbi:antibiotic biosynthesis monooxygenase [Affinibrenneria salicis]|uniref:Antibiotic biosynthesis monooxygenase n=1 Tax=Affinibrenneria salicis TaxID=2590031 RepID=A0A5J5G353_9GAMM|nr:putative quinol monooxygenase [Affinibrenneria salicis]KAA9001192.1 antibiotic biosynthesis monooxygenase [Affinibrenneria salicis]